MSKTVARVSLRRLCGIISLTALLVFVASAAAADSNADGENPGSEGDGKVTIGPEYQIDPDLTDRKNPNGKSFEFSMRLADSKIFRGDDATLDPEKKPVRKERKIFVYVPAAYHDGIVDIDVVTRDAWTLDFTGRVSRSGGRVTGAAAGWAFD